VTASIIAAGFAAFGLAVKYLPIFPEGAGAHGHAGPRREGDRTAPRLGHVSP